MDLDHVEAGTVGVARGLRVVVADAVHFGARDLARHMHEIVERKRRRCDELPIVVGQWVIHSLPTAPGRTFSPRMAELQAEFRRALLVHEIADALPGCDLLGGVDAGAARRDAAGL